MSVTPVLSRDALKLGVDQPTLDNTGVPVGTVLQGVDVNVSYGSADSGTATGFKEIKNMDFRRRVNISGAQYLRFKSCRFRGEPMMADTLIVSTNASNKRIEYVDCDFDPQTPTFRTNVTRGGHHSRWLRCKFRHLADGIGHTNSGGYTADQEVSIEQSFFADYWYASPDADAAGGIKDNASHVDIAIQWRGGAGLYVGGNTIDGLLGEGLENLGLQIKSNTDLAFDSEHKGSDAYRMTVDEYVNGVITKHLRGNKYFDYIRDAQGNVVQPPKLKITNPRLYGQATSLFMFSPNMGPLGAMVFEKNWLDGGSASFNFNPGYTTVANTPVANPKLTVGKIIIRDNKWGPHDHPELPPSMRNGTSWAIVAAAALPLEITGNIRTDTKAAFNTRKNG